MTGRFPHPVRDPAGHSFGHAPATPIALDPERWLESREYLYAIDLFNHGYYWEAHEAWEGIWHAAGRKGALADFLKGLIKLAAAGVKVRERRAEGVRRHAQRARALFAPIDTAEFCGLAMEELMANAAHLVASPPSASELDQPVEIVFDFILAPRVTRLGIDELDSQ